MTYLALLILAAIAAYGVYHWYTHRPQYMPTMPTELRKGLCPEQSIKQAASAAFSLFPH